MGSYFVDLHHSLTRFNRIVLSLLILVPLIFYIVGKMPDVLDIVGTFIALSRRLELYLERGLCILVSPLDLHSLRRHGE